MWRVLLLVCLAHSCSSYRILGFFPLPVVSHHRSFIYPIRELANRGHKIVYVTPIIPDFTHPNIEVRAMKNFREKYAEVFGVNELWKYSVPMRTIIMQRAPEVLEEEFFGDPVVQDLVHGNESFDGVMMESYTLTEGCTAMGHKFGAPVIEIAALGDQNWLYEMGGLPSNPSYMIDFVTYKFSDNMNLWQRIENYYYIWANTIISYVRLWRIQKTVDKYFNYTGWETRPHVGQLLSNRSIILQNRDVALGYPYPLPPHVKDIGGINAVPPKPLPKDIQKYMDESKHGVILFSLGSMLNTSGLTTTRFGEAFFSVFRNLKQNIIMKSEIGRLEVLPPNVMTYKWLPQNDILAHKNCVLFITHGGYNSLIEAVYNEVPVVGIPFFGDQPKNMISVEATGVGLRITRDNVTSESLSWAIHEVLNNPKYKNEVKKRAQMMKERAQTAVQRAAYWIEFAIKYPNFLTPRSASMNFFQVHSFDVKLIIFGSLYILYRLVKLLICLLTRKIKGSPQKVKTS